MDLRPWLSKTVNLKELSGAQDSCRRVCERYFAWSQSVDIVLDDQLHACEFSLA